MHISAANRSMSDSDGRINNPPQDAILPHKGFRHAGERLDGF
jgi:hypothetical protein